MLEPAFGRRLTELTGYEAEMLVSEVDPSGFAITTYVKEKPPVSGSLGQRSASSPSSRRRRPFADFSRQISIAQRFLQTFERYSWFQIEPVTKSTLQAIISFPDKIPARLNAREDLPAVLNVLENFSKFLYAYLPEHATYMEPENLNKLQNEGAECLRTFAQQINDLTAFPPSAKAQESRKEVAHPSIRVRIQKTFYSNVFIRFTVWFVLILLLTTFALFFLNQRMQLSPDTVATLIIGTSIASAAGLAAFLPRTSKPD